MYKYNRKNSGRQRQFQIMNRVTCNQSSLSTFPSPLSPSSHSQRRSGRPHSNAVCVEVHFCGEASEVFSNGTPPKEGFVAPTPPLAAVSSVGHLPHTKCCCVILVGADTPLGGHIPWGFLSFGCVTSVRNNICFPCINANQVRPAKK